MVRILNVDQHRDARGWVVNPVAESKVQDACPGSVHMVSIEPGAVRGNHAHPTSREWFLVCNGPVLIVWRASGDSEISSMTVAHDEPVFIEVDPGCGHAIQNISETTAYLLAFRDRSPSDTLTVPLIGFAQ